MADEDLRGATDEFQRRAARRGMWRARTPPSTTTTCAFSCHRPRRPWPRAQWLEVLPQYVVDEYVTEAVITDVSGDVASSVQRASMKADVLGRGRSGTFVISDAWIRRSDGRRLWRRHSTPLSAGAMPGADQVFVQPPAGPSVDSREGRVPASCGSNSWTSYQTGEGQWRS